MRRVDMRRTYNEATATRLIPLLSSIAAEYIDRAHTIRRLDRRLEALQASDGDQAGTLEVTAQLALERREQRHCSEEVERLGCKLEGGRKALVLIPAAGGKDAPPWCWQAGDLVLQQCEQAVPAA